MSYSYSCNTSANIVCKACTYTAVNAQTCACQETPHVSMYKALCMCLVHWWPTHVGLWRYSRHPNHVGEQMFWWGLAIFAISSGDFWTLIGPLFNTICMVRHQHIHISHIQSALCMESGPSQVYQYVDCAHAMYGHVATYMQCVCSQSPSSFLRLEGRWKHL